jgi:hypothetical protein
VRTVSSSVKFWNLVNLKKAGQPQRKANSLKTTDEPLIFSKNSSAHSWNPLGTEVDKNQSNQ